MEFVDKKTRNEHLASRGFKLSAWVHGVFHPGEAARLHREIAERDDRIDIWVGSVASLRMKELGLEQDKARAEASFEDALVRLSNHEDVGAIKR